MDCSIIHHDSTNYDVKTKHWHSNMNSDILDIRVSVYDVIKRSRDGVYRSTGHPELAAPPFSALRRKQQADVDVRPMRHVRHVTKQTPHASVTRDQSADQSHTTHLSALAQHQSTAAETKSCSAEQLAIDAALFAVASTALLWYGNGNIDTMMTRSGSVTLSIYTTLFTVQRTAATKQLKKEKQQLTVQSGGHICPTV